MLVRTVDYKPLSASFMVIDTMVKSTVISQSIDSLVASGDSLPFSIA